MKRINDFLFHIALLSAVILFGVGLLVLGNFSAAKAEEAAIAQAVADRHYDASLPSVPLRDPLSYDETTDMVNGWGCRLRRAFPYSILAVIQCF